MRVVFMGTPDFSVSALKAIVEAGHDVVAVYTQPPRKAGRGKDLTPTPVHKAAQCLGIDVFHPTSLKGEAQKIADLHAHVAVVVAYGLLLPQDVLDAPEHGCLNIHASLLPRWRGAAPIHRAIMAGDTQTGVGIMQMEAGLDTGPVLLEYPLPIGPRETTGELHDRLSVLGASMIAEALTNLEYLEPKPQAEEGVTYAHKIDKAEAALDWSLSARQVAGHINGLSPFPGAFIEHNGKRVKFLRADVVEGKHGSPAHVLETVPRLVVGCGSGSVEILEVQPAGKKPMSPQAWLNGAGIVCGAQL